MDTRQVKLKDSDSGGKWYVRFPDGYVVARSALYPCFADGKVLYMHYVDPVTGTDYILLDE